MTARITSPAKGLNLLTTFGPYRVEFKNGVAEIDELNEGLRAYLLGAGYEVEDVADAKDDQESAEDDQGTDADASTDQGAEDLLGTDEAPAEDAPADTESEPAKAPARRTRGGTK